MKKHPHSAIVAKFGGIRPMSRDMETSPQLVAYWANKGIPKWRWDSVLSAARKKRLGLTEADFNGAAK